MIKLTKRHKTILKAYSRPIVHMRMQVSQSRFGLIFGAGLSKSFGVPNWEGLVKRLANDPAVNGNGILSLAPPRAGLPYRTEMLFEHYKQSRYKLVPLDQHHTRQLDFSISADWRAIVREHLYSDATDNIASLLRKHPYLNQYLPLIHNSHMTVTYNFDDFIEQSLLSSRSKTEKDSRGFESVTNTWTQFRRPNAVIYHPNGVVPKNPLETPSDRFVFSEASYAEQLMGIFAGDHAGLLNHLSKHSCLLIGLSLEDETLRNVLVQNARSCPGNFHYYVHYMKPGEILTEEERQAIILANFKVYNLVTLFLNDEGIRSLGELIFVPECPENLFCDFAHQHSIPVRFRFYITGPLGVGKSTAINQFRNLTVLDEWLDQRPAVLAKAWVLLTKAEQRFADKWIVGQFELKNEKLRNSREGLFVLDRGPLDPLSFTPANKWDKKANLILSTLCPGVATWEVEDGCVILLKGDSHELALRMIVSQRTDYTADKLADMELNLMKAYGSEGVITFDTKGLSHVDVTRRIAEIIHLENYKQPCNLHKRLQEIKGGH